MSIKTTDLIAEIERRAPLSGAAPWDNSGWQINLHKPEVERVLVALDSTKAVAVEAGEMGADFLLTHHPLFFTPTNMLEKGVDNGGTAIHLIESGISIYSAHTSFDSAQGGINDLLAKALGLTGIHLLPDDEMPAFVRCGSFDPPRTFAEICSSVETALEMKGQLRMVGDADVVVRTGAVCGGSGCSWLVDVAKAGIDLYLTSDIKHDDAIYARAHGICLIDGGHWGTEHHFIHDMAESLREAFGEAVEVIESSVNKSPWND